MQFFKNKTVAGFWFPAVAAMLSLVAAGVYYIGFNGGQYYHAEVLPYTIAAAAIFVVMSLIKPLAKLAALASGLTHFTALLTFINLSYMYLTEAFYDGVSFETIKDMNFAWPIALALFIVSVVLCNIAVYKNPERSE